MRPVFRYATSRTMANRAIFFMGVRLKLSGVDAAGAGAFTIPLDMCFFASDQEPSGFLSSANLAAMVGLPRVSFLIVTSCALSLANRKLRSVPSRASLVF